ncbi:MAG TPA: radical SAM protein [Acidisarcina sp.]|nr:radical SAM protein [Acidisarcina sp.]
MKDSVLKAWSSTLAGRRPSLSIEITRECPLRCPGCYAFDPAHLGGGGITLRQLADYKEDALVQGILRLVDFHRPLHVSLVGGDPLVRYRELEVLLPQLVARGIFVQVVTSAFRPIPSHWASFPRFNLVVSVDGLQPEHDERRKPATYERILKNLQGSVKATIHCTITGQMTAKPNYLEQFLRYWSQRPEARKVWMSIFTPQQGAVGPEILSPQARSEVIAELRRLRPLYPILDMRESLIRELEHPPRSPAECIFARTTETISADLKTRISPCQFGGNPDCSQCGCIASMGLAAIGHYKVVGPLTAGHLYTASEFVGKGVRMLMNKPKETAAR